MLLILIAVSIQVSLEKIQRLKGNQGRSYLAYIFILWYLSTHRASCVQQNSQKRNMVNGTCTCVKLNQFKIAAFTQPANTCLVCM